MGVVGEKGFCSSVEECGAVKSGGSFLEVIAKPYSSLDESCL